MRIVVEGCGQWAMKEYFAALIKYASLDSGVTFTYDSAFGLDLDMYADKLDAQSFIAYLQKTLDNVGEIEKAGFACVDLKHTLYKGKPNPLRTHLPPIADAVFVVTPDRTHCDVAEYWLGKARWIFVEKPFDVSTERIKTFCQAVRSQSYTKVFAIDHYFVRCNHMAADPDYFLSRLLKVNRQGEPQGDIKFFEFCLTESPKKDSNGKYDPSPFRDRVLSLQSGMVFDLGAHALPVMLPFIDFNKPIRVTDVWAGMSSGIRNFMFSGAETFSIAEIECHTRRTKTKPKSQPVKGRIIVGKDIGNRPDKYVVVRGEGGQVRFDLDSYQVHYKPPGASDWHYCAPLQQNWSGLLVQSVLENRVPEAVQGFQPEGALRVVDFLERWRDTCQQNAGNTRRLLSDYLPGASTPELKSKQYQVMKRGKRI